MLIGKYIYIYMNTVNTDAREVKVFTSLQIKQRSLDTAIAVMF